MARINRRKKPTDDDELIYKQVSKVWHDKTKTISYLRGRGSANNPTTKFLTELRKLRG